MKIKHIIFIGCMLFSVCSAAKAAVTLNVCMLTSCATGYYKNGTVCSACPVNSTSSNYNMGGITSCYIPSNSSVSDVNGNVYIYTNNCYYTN